MTEFTPISASIGGALIGLACLLLLFLLGRIAGCSGIVTSALLPKSQKSGDWFWRLCFLLGLISGPILVSLFSNIHLPENYSLSLPVILLGGLFVGLGAAVGGGCTSGHGICGMGRFSKRSIVATSIFTGFAFLTVFIIRHLIGLGEK